MFCCENFQDGQEIGSDADFYGRLIRTKCDVGYLIGASLPAMKFCPWCGSDVRKKHPLEVAAIAVVEKRSGGTHCWEELSDAIANLGKTLDELAP